VGIGAPFSLSVTALDSQGRQVLAVSNVAVSLVLLASPPNGTLAGSLTATMNGGRAVFNALKVTRAGTYIVLVTANGVSTVFSFGTLGRQT
jgi:hypothetical protein